MESYKQNISKSGEMQPSDLEIRPGDNRKMGRRRKPIVRDHPNPIVYELVWGRMDYLLGRRADWPSCDSITPRANPMTVAGSVAVICSPVNMKDAKPDGPLP